MIDSSHIPDPVNDLCEAENRADAYRHVLKNLLDVIFEEVADTATKQLLLPAVNDAMRIIHHYECDNCALHEELPL
jgi:hypothetical protein